MPYQILVIEDDRDIARLLARHLKDLSYAVTIASNGEQGLADARTGRYDLIVLDLMLPLLDGLAVCRQLRGQGDNTPIMMLTAKSSELDRVLGLELGADDYLTKPFSVQEFQARARAILRRVEMARSDSVSQAPASIAVNDLVIDPARRTVSVKGNPVTLTAREFELLLHFARNPGRVYNRTQLLDQVWGYAHDGYEHTVNSHINRLRKKIELDPARSQYIQTVWGVGYKFAEPVA